MIAIDTNVLLRYLLADDAHQFRRAKMLIEKNHPVMVTDVALAETIWTLAGKRYKFDKTAVCDVIRKLISDSGFMFENNQVIWSSLRDYEESKPIRGKLLDFNDALIANKARLCIETSGRSFSGFFSFDKTVEQLVGTKIP